MSVPQREERNIPENVTFETMNRILLAYLRAGAFEGPVNYREATSRSGVHRTVVSLNNKFLVSAGFLTEEARGTYRLSEKAVRYVQLLDWNKIEESKEPLREILTEYAYFKSLLDFVIINRKVTREDLMTRIITDLGLRRNVRYTMGMNALLDMLVFSGLLKEEDGSYSAVRFEKGILKGTQPERPAPLLTSEPEKKAVTMPISISLVVDENTNIEKLKTILKAVKEVLQE